MTAVKALGTTGNGVGVVTPLDHKLAIAALLYKTSTALLARAGVFYAGNSSLVAGTAGMAYSVSPYQCALTRGATSGATLGGNDGTLSVATTAAPGSNSRYDVVYQWHREYSLDGVNSDPVIGVVQGTAAASPTVPSLAAFPGAIELARILVPAGVTATNSGTTITQTAPFTTVDGGTLPFRTKTEMNAFTSAPTDARARDLSTGVIYKWNGSSWVGVDSSIIPGSPTSTGGSASLSPSGEVSFTGATTALLVPGVFGSGFITEIEVEIFTSSGASNGSWQLVTAAGVPLASGYTTNMIQIPLTAGAVSSVASAATGWFNLRVQGTTGGHFLARVARAADAIRKTMLGQNIDATTLDGPAGGTNPSTALHTGVKFDFGGATCTGVARFRAITNQS